MVTPQRCRASPCDLVRCMPRHARAALDAGDECAGDLDDGEGGTEGATPRVLS